MDPFTFQTTSNVLFEAGAARKPPEIVGSFGAKRVLLVTTMGARRAALRPAAEATLTDAGVTRAEGRKRSADAGRRHFSRPPKEPLDA